MHKYSIRRKKKEDLKGEAPPRAINLIRSDEFDRAFDLLENSREHIFLTGRAGTGKSTLLNYWRDNTVKNIVILAPTGVAALNVRGQTVHSFFGFKPSTTLANIYKQGKTGNNNMYQKLDAIVIDEVSMVRADLLDCIDKFMRLNGRDRNAPFGGTQMIFVGDLFQLPPVLTENERQAFESLYTTPYFFSARVLNEQKLFGSVVSLQTFCLERIHRQTDKSFIELLNRVRSNGTTEEDLSILNKRVNPRASTDNCEILLTATNSQAAMINDTRLRTLPGREYNLAGVIDGDFDRRSLPTEENLRLKIGAQVMLIANDSMGQWVNGSIGIVQSVEADENGLIFVMVELEDGNVVQVGPHTWDLYRYKFNKHTESLQSKSIGKFMQYPLKLAWAVTIHKSQGKTFSKAVIDVGRGIFAHGQLYVALSRCRSLDGITLSRPLSFRDVIVDDRVAEFMRGTVSASF
ncbi:MAG TPA: DEAD/DEAH box helicase [Candidatus Magasanikbacteria bacterium]|nr:DEAD/DEAH box helicase [Candidatus Magasanikbacteria bacterium]